MGQGFELATAVTRVDGGTEPLAGPGDTARFATAVHDGWDINGVANGGYVLAIVGRAMAAATGRPPLTVTCHFLHPARPGDAEIVVEAVRVGARLVTVTASMRQAGHELVRVLATLGTAKDVGVRAMAAGPPELPPFDQCVGPVAEAGEDGAGAWNPGTDFQPPPLFRQLGVRMRPGDEGFRDGRPSGTAEIAGWFSFGDESPIDKIALLLVADAFPPPVFNAGIGPGWVPTVELTVHVRADPAPGPLRCRYHSDFVEAGVLSEDAEIWDSRGVLVAQSRQLALPPRT